jgi:arabinofuranosyltransferase
MSDTSAAADLSDSDAAPRALNGETHSRHANAPAFYGAAQRVRLLARKYPLRLVAWALVAAALLWHARSYDFFADDAFIALRYSESLLERGELSYNPGERVEGFTSPLWVLLVALLGALASPLHVTLVDCARALGAACAVATLWAMARAWREAAPGRSRWLAVVAGMLLAASTPFAAWTLGGLEAPLFALCLTLALTGLAVARGAVGERAWLQAGALCALAALARPEGFGIVAAGAVAALLPSAVARIRWHRRLPAFAAPVALLLGGYMAFRLSYYGDPLPNTYYVKLTGGEALARRGARYVEGMAAEFGLATCVAAAVAFVAPLAFAPRYFRRWLALESSTLWHGLARLMLALYVVYLARIGGDFLDAYRFVAPLLPSLLVMVVAAAAQGLEQVHARTSARWRPVSLALATCLLAALLFDYGRHQLWMGVRASGASWYERPADAPSKPKGVEGLTWTRKAALQWSALGRALAEVSAPGDTLAVGAAGAIPYYAKLPALDLHGLNDAWIARNGQIAGNRPGHQRFAPRSYIRDRRPTFLLLDGWEFAKKPSSLRAPDSFWARHGYVAAELRVEERHGAPSTYYQPLLLLRSRVSALGAHDGLRIRQ